MPCLKCGGKTEDEALICDSCAESSFQDPEFFLNPVLVGPSIFSRLRATGSAAHILGPNTHSNIVPVPSADLVTPIAELNVHALPREEVKPFYERCNSLLGHLGVPLKVDTPDLLLTKDAAEIITVVIQKINATETMYGGETLSDLYIRVGMLYWSASHGILLRTASKNWQKEKKSYLVSRAKAFLSKVQPGDDLHSIAARTLGLICLDSEEWTEAEEHLSDALRQFPDDLVVGEGLARAHLMLGNPMEALSRVDDVINQGEKPELWVLKGKILRDLDRGREALECFSRAISLDSSYLPAHDIMIQSLRDMGRMEEAAMAESQRSLARKPDLERRIGELIAEYKKPVVEVAAPAVPTPAPRVEAPKPLPEEPSKKEPIDLARAALRAKDYDTAIQRALEILRESPDSKDAALLIIEADLAKGDVKDASTRAHSFYEKNNEDPLAWYWRGVVADREGRWGAAVQYLSKAVTLDPKLVDAWNAMGETLLTHEKAAGADESFTRALELDPENPRSWLGKAKTMNALGRWGASIQSFDKYNSLVPGDKDVWRIKGDLLFEKEKYSRAIEAYDMYLGLAQDDSHVLARKGIALNAIGMAEEAKACLEESVRLDPENKEAAKWLKSISGGGS